MGIAIKFSVVGMDYCISLFGLEITKKKWIGFGVEHMNTCSAQNAPQGRFRKIEKYK